MIRLEGSQDEIRELRKAIEEHEPSLAAAEMGEVRRRESFGMEPLAYLVVVFAGHLTAAIAHDQIKAILKRYLRKDTSVQIIEKDEDQEL